MIDKSVRVKREELRRKSTTLKGMAFEEKNDKTKTEELRYKQGELYKQWEFYDKLIKKIEKMDNYEVYDKKKKQR